MQQTIVAALLNGCLGRPDVTEEQISERFGPGIARMVADLARIDQIANVDAVIADKDQNQHEENLRRLLLGIAEDVRVVLVVLAERLHLMRTIKHLDEARRRKIAGDSQRVYAPLANRLGVWQVKWELEDLSLRYLEPAEYKRIAKLLDGRRANREAYIANVIVILHQKFAEAGIEAEITGRPKHIFSIWRKMQRKNVDIEQIFDLRAVRILVDDIASCYATLGIVHGLWTHIPQEFDDYIATPKGNLYRSLHTAVIGPEDKPLEVQIRTREMHRDAELGVAAHWAYKESRGHDAEFQRRVVNMRNWLERKDDGRGALAEQIQVRPRAGPYLRAHPPVQGDRAAHGRDAAGLRLQHPFRDRKPLSRCPHRRAHRAPQSAARQWSDGGDPHPKERHSKPRLAEPAPRVHHHLQGA